MLHLIKNTKTAILLISVNFQICFWLRYELKSRTPPNIFFYIFVALTATPLVRRDTELIHSYKDSLS